MRDEFANYITSADIAIYSLLFKCVAFQLIQSEGLVLRLLSGNRLDQMLQRLPGLRINIESVLDRYNLFESVNRS